MFIGTYQHNIDAKGRIIMPAKFREELGEAFYVTKGIHTGPEEGKGCLQVLSLAKWEEFLGADVSEPNAQGRILIPDHLRQHACLEKEAVIIGCGTRVEIWNRENWENYLDRQAGEDIVALLEMI